MKARRFSGKDWWYYLFPAFICAAGAERGLAMPALATAAGFVGEAIIIQVAFSTAGGRRRGLTIVVVPLGLLLAAELSPFGAAVVLSPDQVWGRMMVAGVGGILTMATAWLVVQLPPGYWKRIAIGGLIMAGLAIVPLLLGYSRGSILYRAASGSLWGAIIGLVVAMVTARTGQVRE